MDLFDVSEAELQSLIRKGVVRASRANEELFEWCAGDEAIALQDLLGTLKRMRARHKKAKQALLS